MQKKVLVLGGSYFVGRKIVEYLSQKQYEVTVLNRGTKPVPLEGVRQLIADRNDLVRMKDVLKDQNFDFVIDVSWQDLSWVENACKSIDFTTVKKYIFISSSAVYDVESLHIPYKEENPLSENKYWTFYGKGKIDAEKYYTGFMKDVATQLVILRPPYIYGEYNYAQRESLIFRQLLEDAPIVIPSSNPKLQFIYTQDLADIIDTLLKTELGKCNIYNVGNQKGVTSKEWIEACAQVAGKKPKIVELDYQTLGKNVREFYPFFDYDNILDISRIQSIWNHETDFNVGLEHAFAWFQQNRDEISFKKNVDQTLYEIIAKMSI